MKYGRWGGDEFTLVFLVAELGSNILGHVDVEAGELVAVLEAQTWLVVLDADADLVAGAFIAAGIAAAT